MIARVTDLELMTLSRATATLSSLSTSLGDCESRLAALASEYEGSDRDDLVSALHEAERMVRSAEREVRRAQRLLR
jgi:hypothetical protein